MKKAKRKTAYLQSITLIPGKQEDGEDRSG